MSLGMPWGKEGGTNGYIMSVWVTIVDALLYMITTRINFRLNANTLMSQSYLFHFGSRTKYEDMYSIWFCFLNTINV